MKKKRFVELAYLRINGGVLSPDHTVQRNDIKAYIPIAINTALDNAYNQNKNIEGIGDLPSQFYGFFGPVELDTSKKPFILNLEKSTVPLKGGYGLKNVMDQYGNFYAPVPDHLVPNLKYTFQNTPGINWYRRVGDRRVEIWTHNDLLEGITYQAISDIDLIGDDDELPIQAGQDPLVMDLVVSHFMGTKGMLYDNASDNKDDINASR